MNQKKYTSVCVWTSSFSFNLLCNICCFPGHTFSLFQAFIQIHISPISMEYDHFKVFACTVAQRLKLSSGMQPYWMVKLTVISEQWRLFCINRDTPITAFGRSINGVQKILSKVMEGGIFPTCQLCVVPLFKHSEIRLVLRLRGSCGSWRVRLACMQWEQSEARHRAMNRQGSGGKRQLNQ